MLTKRISSRDARAHFSELLGQVYYTKEAVIVERKGKPIAAIVSPEQLDELERFKAKVDHRGGRERNADQNPDEAYREVTEVVEQVRQNNEVKAGATKSRG